MTDVATERSPLAAAKHWAYPFALRDSTHPNDLISHFHALSAMEYGFFPIARSGYPNGSVHIGKQCISFTTEDGFRSMADGEVIAYRLDGILLPLRYSGQRMLRYSLGFVLVRHRLTLPALPVATVPAAAGAARTSASTSTTPAPVVADSADNGIYIYSLYSYNKPLGRFPTDADGFLTVSLPFWKGTRNYRVGLLAKDKQAAAPTRRASTHARPGAHAVPAGTRPAPVPAPATGLRVRASGVGTAAIVGFLPRDCRLTLRVDVTRGWAQVNAITQGTPLSNIVGGEVSLTAINEGWVFVGELDSTPVPDPINTVVVLDTPYPVKAGDLLGFMGENPGASMALPEGSIHPDHPVVAIEVFAGADFPAHLVESRRRAATLPDEEKTILVIERGAKLCASLRPPTQMLPVGNRIVPGPGDSTKGRLVHGGRYTVTRQSKAVAVPATGKIGDYFKTGGLDPISEATYNRLTSAEKAEYVEREALSRVGTQLYWAPKVQPSDRCIAVWVDSPLVAEDADVVAAFQATFTALDLSALDESRFIGGPDGVRWWNVQVGGAGNEAIYAWVCSENHPLTRWESPQAWPGFHIADGSAFTPLSAMQRIVTIHGTVHPQDEESFSPSVNVLGSSEMVVKLEEAIDHSGTLDGKITAADIANARNTPWLARGLSRIIAKLESQWSGNIARWEAVTPFMNADWPTEMERQRLRGWWREVATKVPGFPQDPCVHHIHPFGWVANFQPCPSIHPTITVAGERKVIPFLLQRIGPGIEDVDYQNAASDLECEEDAIRAVALTETKEVGPFFVPGQTHAAGDDYVPSILYERHIFHKFTSGAHDTEAPDLSDRAPTPKGGYGPPSSQYSKLLRARGMNEEAALKSASWGRFQIMGFNHIACGYESVYSYVEAMSLSEVKHIEAFVKYIKAHPRLLRAIRAKDWASFATNYNGPKHENYDIKMQNNYNSLTRRTT